VPRRRRRWARVLIPLFLLLAAIPVVIIVIAVAVLASGGFEFGSGFSVTYVPMTVDEIPATIDHGQGELVVDLTEIDPATYDGGPVPIDIDMGMGEVRVLVPDGLSVDVDAEVTAGDINVLGNTKDGLGVDLSVPADEPDVELDIDLQFGKITVQRVAP
jgi:predicted membrane protein